MAYTEDVLARAEARLRADQKAHREQQEALRKEIYKALPRTAEIDRQLRRTAPRILAVSLRQGLDSKAAVDALRRESLALQDEEAALLAGAGYPADALEETPLCPNCGDRGWKGAEMCRCLKALCGEEQLKSLSSLLDLGSQSFETFRLDYYDREAWPETRRSPRENMEAILTNCRSYADFFGAYPHKNLFLYGSPGLGKTFLSACIARVVAEKGFSVVYDTAGNLFSRFEARKFARDDDQQAQRDVHRYLVCDLLILDDLGSEFTTPLVQSSLYEVVNTRLMTGRHTVISSNLDSAAIRQRYSAQVASRLEGEYLFLPFFGRDIRKKTKGK